MARRCAGWRGGVGLAGVSWGDVGWRGGGVGRRHREGLGLRFAWRDLFRCFLGRRQFFQSYASTTRSLQRLCRARRSLEKVSSWQLPGARLRSCDLSTASKNIFRNGFIFENGTLAAARAHFTKSNLQGGGIVRDVFGIAFRDMGSGSCQGVDFENETVAKTILGSRCQISISQTNAWQLPGWNFLKRSFGGWRRVAWAWLSGGVGRRGVGWCGVARAGVA